jgi:hypothetical protein
VRKNYCGKGLRNIDDHKRFMRINVEGQIATRKSPSTSLESFRGLFPEIFLGESISKSSICGGMIPISRF